MRYFRTPLGLSKISCLSCYSNPASSLLWSQLASYLLQACPDEQEVMTNSWLQLSCFHLSVESNSHLLWFCISRPAIGYTNSCYFFNQSEKRSKQIMPRSLTSSRASRALHVFASSFDGFSRLSMSVVIGQSGTLGRAGFTNSIGNHSRAVFNRVPKNENPSYYYSVQSQGIRNPVNQSKPEANRCNWREARENMCERVAIGFGFISNWF